MSRVIIRIPILGLPVGANEASRLLKIGCFVDVLLAALDLGLHASTCLAPLTQVCCRLLVASFVHQLLILVMEPYLLQLLLLQVICWVVSVVVGAALKLVDGRELHFLRLGARVERFEWWAVGGALRLSEGAASIGEVLGSGCGGRSHGALVVYNRHIVDRSKLRCHQAMLTLLLL